jgi:hypothetical protein
MFLFMGTILVSCNPDGRKRIQINEEKQAAWDGQLHCSTLFIFGVESSELLRNEKK